MMRVAMAVPVLACILALPARAQDPVQVDSTHYRVEFENDCVRVLRIRYGPGERSVMHDHPDGVGVLLSDAQFRFTMPDGSTRDLTAAAGEVQWAPAGPHLPENRGMAPAEVVLVELKPGRGAACEMPSAGGETPSAGP
jgi:hypothetical protein